MNREEKYLSSLMFKNLILSSDGQKFEDVFTNVLEKHNKNFKKVKPQGSYGDRKNDGYDQSTGEYYQVYAPEDINQSINKAISKLLTDFKGLKRYWDNICPITKYNFVLNDKYKGAPAELHREILKLKKKYSNIDFNLFTCSNLEDCFINLNDTEAINIIGLIPNPNSIGFIKLDSVTEVIDFILNKQEAINYESSLISPNFNKKIIFNNLDNTISALLRNGNLQSSVLNDYFKYNSSYKKEDLRDRINTIYEEAKKIIGTDSNQIFFYILDKISPKPITKNIQDACIIVMSYFFETCDIFETPN